jgi:hypothetical protein
MAADAEKPPLSAVGQVLDGLETSDASRRRECLTRLERWAEDGLPHGAGPLVIDRAARSFPPTDQYPATPNEALLRLLWNGKTTVAGDDVEAVFPQLDEACRACAIRLLAELGTRTASESLARIISSCARDGLPKVGWPLLLPLERAPWAPDVLIPALLDFVGETVGVGPVHSALLGYVKAGMLTPEQSRTCAEIISGQVSHYIDDLHRRLAALGLADRWNDDYASVRTGANLLLDLLGRLDQPCALPVFESAVHLLDPWIKLWGAMGLISRGRSVDPQVFRQIAEWAECRLPLARELQALDRSDLFPADFLNQPSLAEAALVEWLIVPTELGRAPDEIRQLELLPMETDDGVADLYVFAFRTHPPHWLSEKDWVVGVAGPFLASDQPTFEGLGATFSRFEPLSDRPLEEHVEVLLDTVDGISGSDD